MKPIPKPVDVEVIPLWDKRVRREKLGKWIIIGLVFLWFAFLVLFPLYGIFREAGEEGLKTIFASLKTSDSIHAFYLTFITTLVAVILNTVFGVIMAIVFARQKFKGKLLLESIVDMPFAISPIVAGFMFVVLFGPEGWIGSWFESMNIKILYAIPGMMLATVFITIPFVAREILPILREFGREEEEAAATLGASRWQAFWRVTLPSIKWGLAYGVTLTIARSIGEFGAVLVVSGSIINMTQTATLRIHDQFMNYNYPGAFSAALVLAVFSFVILLFIQYAYKKKGGPLL